MNKLGYLGLLVAIIGLMLISAHESSATAPARIPFQASGFRLSNGSLIPASNVTLYVYTAMTGGTPIYNETFPAGLINGYVSVTMGNDTAGNPLNLNWGQTYYLALDINGTSVSMIDTYGVSSTRQAFVSTQGEILSLSSFYSNLTSLQTSNTSTNLRVDDLNSTIKTLNNLSYSQIASNIGNWTAEKLTLNNLSLPNISANIGNFSLYNSSLARTGSQYCSSGTVMQNITVNTSGVYANCSTDATGGGGGGTSFNITELWDSELYYRRTSFESITAVYTQPWVPGALASGTVALRAGEYYHPGIGRVSSSATASSGYQFSITGATTYSLGENYTTQASFRPNAAKCYWNTTYPLALPYANNGTRIIFGFVDAFTAATQVDGVYFNVTQLNETHFYARGMSIANGALATTASNWTFRNYTWQTYTVYINSTSLATFIITNGTTEYWRDTVATVPNGVGRETSNAIIAYQNGTIFGGAQILVDIDHLGVGINRRLLR